MSDAAMNDAPVAAATAAAAAAPAPAPPGGSSKSERKRKRDGDIDIAADSPADPATAATAAVPAAAAASAPSAGAAASPAPLLLTTRGSEVIRAALATQHPTTFIQQFQAEHGIRVPALESSLSFLDLFVSKRSGIYSTLLNELNEKLVDKIRTGAVEKERIPVLLESSFAYIAVDELRSVPIALLMSLLASSGSIPSKYLKVLLASPPKLQESLPLPLRRALMESDPARLFWNQAYWQALLAAYANDSARIESYNTVWPLEPMVAACRKVRKDGNGPTSSSNAAAVSPSAQALRGMLEWIGSSSKLYDFTCAQLRELTMAAERTGRFSEAQLWRSMRVDLIMRLHETDQEAKHHHHASTAAGSVGTAAASSSNSSFAAPHRSSHLASHIDHLHTWVWCLDAGSRDSGQLNQKLLEKLLGGESSPGLLATIKPKHVGRHCFAELSMLASHPAIVLTLLQSIVTALSQSVEKEITPKEHAQIKSLTNLLHLALSPVLPLLRTDAPVPPLSLPEPSNLEVLLTEFYPFVAELIIYAQLGEMEPLNPKLLDHVESSPVSRYVFLFYLLSRLQAQDVLQSSALLACLPNIRVPAASGTGVGIGGESLWSVESSHGDQQLLNGMLQTTASLIIGIKHVLKTDAAFRTAVFPNCFLLLARSSQFAHKQCLRLLLACVDCLTVDESAAFIAQLQREGKRGDVASPDSAAAAAAAASAANTAEAPAAPTPLSQLPSQIASLYRQFQASHPQLFKAAAARKTS